MHWLDWYLIFIPLLIVLFVCWKSQRYVKGVSDFLAASRVAGRYVIAVAGGEAACGLISVIAMIEVYMASGFGYSFWSKLTTPLALFFGLTGFCTYRYRETRALTFGQFLEMRYSRPFRIFAACIQFLSGLVNYAIFPAIGARFLIYFLDLPIYLNCFGWHFPTYGLMLILCIGIAAAIACLGGQITIMVSDCVQGIISYPLYMILVVYLFYRFSWNSDILPTISAREPGMSFLNPYDIHKLRDFNLFYVFAGIFNSFFNRLSWAGCQGYMAAARSAHEEKMGGLLGTWRAGFSTMTITLIALVTYVFVSNPKYQADVQDASTGRVVAAGVNSVNKMLALKTLADVAKDQPQEVLDRIASRIQDAKPRFDAATNTEVDSEPAGSTTAMTSDNYSRVAVEELKKEDLKVAQTYGSIHNQMLSTLSMREILPIGLTGVFAALMIFLMISTDNTYMHSWGSILIQDIVIPLRKNKAPLAPKSQLRLLRAGILFVAAFAFVFSLYFAQVDYIMMFFAITGAIWCGGGAVITLGLYWRKGTTAGAFTGVLAGAIVGVGGMLLQMNWVKHLYPWLVQHNLDKSLDAILVAITKPFHPYIIWTVTPDKFPINSTELGFIGLLSAVLGYILVSWLTCRKPFNLERMLHRGQYSQGESKGNDGKITARKIFHVLVGITPEYTLGDKVLAWSVFGYSLIYGFVLCVLLPIIWNIFYKWPSAWWGTYFFITSILVTCIVGVVSTFWFTIGGYRDLVQLFRDLARKKVNEQDNGIVAHEEE